MAYFIEAKWQYWRPTLRMSQFCTVLFVFINTPERQVRPASRGKSVRLVAIFVLFATAAAGSSASRFTARAAIRSTSFSASSAYWIASSRFFWYGTRVNNSSSHWLLNNNTTTRQPLLTWRKKYSENARYASDINMYSADESCVPDFLSASHTLVAFLTGAALDVGLVWMTLMAAVCETINSPLFNVANCSLIADAHNCPRAAHKFWSLFMSIKHALGHWYCHACLSRVANG